MAFLLRNISRSAGGREIIRESRVDEDLLRIGRDPNSDIRLNDLAIALHHATLELVGGGEQAIALDQVAVLLQRKAGALNRIRRHVRYRALLEIWLYVHVPLTFATIAALAAHIISVFFYW